VSDIDTAAVDSLKVLDPKRPIREADIRNREPAWHYSHRTGARSRAATYSIVRLNQKRITGRDFRFMLPSYHASAAGRIF